MNVVFDKKALLDIDNIYDWIAQDSSRVALGVIERMLDSIDNLAVFLAWGARDTSPACGSGQSLDCHTSCRIRSTTP
jgi:plasmid stabilization system protein ParE